MKSNLACILAIMAMTSGTSVSAREGGTGGRGADTSSIGAESAWFVGFTPVKYCFERDKTFPKSDAEVGELVDQAIEGWRKYAYAKRVYQPDLNPAAVFAMNFSKLTKCDGNENLKFYFGVTNRAFEKERKAFDSPSAFPKLVTRGDENKHGFGFVWVAPSKTAPAESPIDWNQPNALYAILLHEVGHIFGTSHRENTIMSEFLPMVIQHWKDQPDQAFRLTTIDGSKELAFCVECEIEYPGAFSSYRLAHPDRASEDDGRYGAAIFKQFLGRDPVGKVTPRLRSEYQIHFKYILRDEGTGQEYEIPIENSTDSSFYNIPAVSFKVGKEGSPQHPRKPMGVWYTQGTWYGKIMEFDGTLRDVTIELNTEDRIYSGSEFEPFSVGPISLRILGPSGRTPLFVAGYPEYTRVSAKPARFPHWLYPHEQAK